MSSRSGLVIVASAYALFAALSSVVDLDIVGLLGITSTFISRGPLQRGRRGFGLHFYVRFVILRGRALVSIAMGDGRRAVPARRLQSSFCLCHPLLRLARVSQRCFGLIPILFLRTDGTSTLEPK